MYSFKHYIRLNNDNCIIKTFSTSVEQPIEGDICINEDTDDRYYTLNIVDIYNRYNYKYVNGEIVERTEDEKYPLSQYILDKVKYVSDLSFTQRQELISDYRLVNAALGVSYDENNNNQYKNTVNAFRTEYYRIKALIEACITKVEVDTVLTGINFPTSLVNS